MIYETATVTHDLSADRHAIDHIIAAGMSKHRIGHDLMRLHTRPTKRAFDALVAVLHSRATDEVPVAFAANVLAWWLDQTCKHCDGHGYTKSPGAPALSAHKCNKCHGSGKSNIPHGSIGKAIANDIDDCVASARASIKMRLRGMH